MIVDFSIYPDYLARLDREEGLPRISIRHFATGEEHAIAFAEEIYSLSIDRRSCPPALWLAGSLAEHSI